MGMYLASEFERKKYDIKSRMEEYVVYGEIFF